MPKSILAATLLALMLGLGACRTIKVTYDHADWFIMREVNSFFCPPPAQQPRWEAAAQRIMAWHRESELEWYAETFDELAAGLEGDDPVPRKVIDQLASFLDKAWGRVLVVAEAHSAPLILRLGPDQIRCLERRMAKETAEDREPFELKGEAYAKKRLEDIYDRFEHWTGDFTAAQKAEVAKLARPDKAWDEKVMKGIDAGRARFLEVVRMKDGEAKAKALSALYRDRFEVYPKAFRPVLKEREKRMTERVWRILRLLDPKQKDHLRRRLRWYAGIFRELAADNP